MLNNSKVVTEHEVSDDAEQGIPKGKAEKKAGKRIGYNYIIIKSLKESQKNDVVKCIYIKSLFNFGFCVIKEGTSGDTMDKYGRDIKDRLRWQEELHQILQHDVKVPKLLGSFNENGNYYLVIERIKGKPLNRWLRENKNELRNDLLKGTAKGVLYIGYLLQISKLLEKLHAHNIVHRDATANNFIIMPNGKVAIIDMELSYSLNKDYPNPPFQLGTRGYMSPEQEEALTPTKKEDLFSIGAIILQSWSGISPSKMTKSSTGDLKKKIDFFIPDREIADITFHCLHPDPMKRPALHTICQALEKLKSDFKYKKQRSFNRYIPVSDQEIHATLEQAITTLGSPLLMDREKGWFSENMDIRSRQEKTKINKSWYGSFSRGAAGILYFLCQAKNVGMDIMPVQEGINKGMNLIIKKYYEGFEFSSPGLHYGSDGVALALVELTRSGLYDPPLDLGAWLKKLLHRTSEKSGVFYGTAGQGLSLIKCSQYVSPAFFSEKLNAITNNLIETQSKNGSWQYRGKDTISFSHGTAGIVYYLLNAGIKYNNQGAIEAAERGLAWLIRQAESRHNGYTWKETKSKDTSIRFCDGGVGIALTFLKAFDLLQSPLYKKIATGILNTFPHDIFQNSLGQCHGVSGAGEAYLEAFIVLNDDRWMERARHIAQMIMHLKIVHPEYGPYWLTEQEQQPIANFMAGNTGILHFLLRYCYPQQIKNSIL